MSTKLNVQFIYNKFTLLKYKQTSLIFDLLKYLLFQINKTSLFAPVWFLGEFHPRNQKIKRCYILHTKKLC